MKFNSIITNIKIGFAITLVLFTVVFAAFLKYENEQIERIAVDYHKNIANYIYVSKPNKDTTVKYIQNLNFKDERNHKQVLKNSRIILAKRGFETISYANKYYLHIKTPHFKVLFEDLNEYKTSYYGYILFAIFFLLIVFSYMWIIRSLQPLHNLKKEIQKFSNGELNINTKSDKKDEIAQLANEFDKAVKKISLLLNSRQLFLRTIVHELKTPIAKGRIVSELIDNDKQKNRMIVIFKKLNFLIDDFAKIEQVVSGNYAVNINSFTINKIIQNSVDMLMLENTNDIKMEELSEHKLNVDLAMFSMAIKNLLDNALKYSSDSKVIIQEGENELLFISKGKKLQKPLEEYYKPFHNDTSSKNHGMGLGLYIVKSILDIHQFGFQYKYTKENNIFKIIF